MKPLDHAEITTKVDLDYRYLKDALLNRHYGEAAALMLEIQQSFMLLAIWLGSVKDGDHVSNS